MKKLMNFESDNIEMDRSILGVDNDNVASKIQSMY